MIEKAIEALNEAFRNDPKAVESIFSRRVECNQQLADHPTVQVGCDDYVSTGFTVGAIGLLNGAIEPLTGERIALQYDDEKRFVGFVKYTP